MRDDSLSRAIEAAGGVMALAGALKVSGAAVSQWRRCPAERVLAVEAATAGKVTRHELRPDLYPPPTDTPPPDPDLDRSPPVAGVDTGGNDKRDAA